MIVVQFILFKSPARVACRGAVHSAESNSIVLVDPETVVVGAESDYDVHAFHVGDFQELYREISDQVESTFAAPFRRKPITVLPVPPDLFDVSRRLGNVDRGLMLRFIFIYCLSINRPYFSSLLHHFVDGSLEFFDYIERNSLNPWSVETYARELGLSIRLLNDMFQDKYGVSTKHWLLERRLQRARELLLGTSKKVTDIAHECGFNSHAHFSDTFRRRYKYCPRKMRQDRVGI
ncbi:helix-turn-helix transcriptional regulator [Paraburkholderia sediminicola]|uniref:helix-turn-helix transcriptional regulator n=1 Tax=Paraburkholderia sediminicola TaxID=458836 RepID=UPI0038BA649E